MLPLCYDVTVFVRELQEILAAVPAGQDHAFVYLDISQSCEIDETKLHESMGQLPPGDPLVKALGRVLSTMKEGPFELTRLGINELIKSYLYRVNKENQEPYTHAYLNCIQQIYLTGAAGNYPFIDLLWEYLSRIFHTVSIFLLDRYLVQACRIFLSKVSSMGRSAAQRGLPTSSIQHFLYNMEIRAHEEGFAELARTAKSHRFNLETF